MRYFYSCPLEAATMCKLHGFQIRPDTWTDEHIYDWRHIIEYSHPAFEGRYYLTPESESLLNVRRGDLIKTQALTALGEEDFNEFIYWVAENPCNIEDVIAIVQRNGKPWFTPEREEVV